MNTTDYLHFGQKGVEKVQTDYVKQFFNVLQVEKLMVDIQNSSYSRVEKKLLNKLGLKGIM